MKIVSLFVMFVLLGVYANAQSTKVLAEIAANSEGNVKNSPFSAEAVSESVQTLADGNRIVRNSTSKLYRNSEGRFRREMTSGSGGMFGYAYGPGVSLVDPVGGFRYLIDPNLRTTRQMMIKPRTELKIVNGVATASTSIEGRYLADKVRAEIKAAAVAGGGSETEVIVSDKVREELKTVIATAPIAATAVVTGQLLATAPEGGISMAYSTGGSGSKWDTRTEQLGVQNIEGVEAEGTRTVTTIPAGSIGNERPIEITYEKWYSKELQLVVMSKHNDPRFGEQTYRLTNIVRSEPDPSLFTLPNGYKLITEPSGTYTVSPATKATHVERSVPAPKATQAATTYVKTKP